MKGMLLLVSLCAMTNGFAQIKNTMEPNKTTNPLLCDPVEGVCGVPGQAQEAHGTLEGQALKPVKVVYFTDPICSSCWGIEPQLRKLKLEYGHLLEIEYRMGGLLPDWSYNSGGISKPSDVAGHWDEVSHHYEMPIDGDVWLEDPLPSSYPPSIAFKAAQMQDGVKALYFLRRIREMVFLEKKNICKWEHLQQAAIETGLDVTRLKADYEGKAKDKFTEDLDYARRLGVRGFPTLFFAYGNKSPITLYGFRPYDDFEGVVKMQYPAAFKKTYGTDLPALLAIYPTLTTKEFAVLAGIHTTEAEATLNDAFAKGLLEQTKTKNGSLWKVKKRQD